jgi:glyoxylase-like metal-dependent hydrolase (beta-lactamase superfamily II)
MVPEWCQWQESLMTDVAVDDPTADWTAPGAYAVAPGVYRIPLPLPMDGLRAVNVYAIVEGSNLVVVDSGWAIAEARTQLQAGLTAIGAGLADVDQFLITHVHRDHYTQAIMLRREFGTKVALGSGEQGSLARVSDPEKSPEYPQIPLLRVAGAGQLLDQLVALEGTAPEIDPRVWEPPDEWLADQVIASVGSRGLRGIATPGHTQGHMVFADEAAGLLFAGDHVLPHITPSIGFEAVPADFPLRDYLDSLRLVRALPDMRLLPAHGPVTPSVHARIDELLDHHDKRLDASLATVRQGATTAYAAAGLLTWTRRERRLAELDPVNAMLAVLETMSHLDVLVLQGRLSVAEVDGVRHYAVS